VLVGELRGQPARSAWTPRKAASAQHNARRAAGPLFVAWSRVPGLAGYAGASDGEDAPAGRPVHSCVDQLAGCVTTGLPSCMTVTAGRAPV
jgi:uncharacterized protein with LGFP repeats